MSSVLSPYASPAATTAAIGERSVPIADDLALFQPPRLSANVLDGLVEGIREKLDLAEFDPNRPGIASVILLAHALALLSEQDIDRAVRKGWRSVLQIYRTAMKKIAAHLESEARNVAGPQDNHRDFESIGIWLDHHDRFYLLLSCGLRYSELAITDLPPEIGRVVLGCLKFAIRQLGAGVLADDPVDYEFWSEEERAEFDTLKAAHPTVDHVALARIALTDEESMFHAYGDDASVVNRFDFFQSLERRIDTVFGTTPELDEIRRTVAAWRRINPVIYRNPWIRFIRRTVLCCKRFLASPQRSEGIVEQSEWDCGEAPFDYGHIIGIGFDWETQVAEDFLNNLYQTGETPVMRVSLDPVAIPQVAEILVSLARARGLLRLAEITALSMSQVDFHARTSE